MTQLSIDQLTREDLELNLNEGGLRLTQILQFALTAGPVAFLGVVVLLRFTAMPAEAAADSPTGMLLLALGPIVVAIYTGAVVIDRLLLAPDKLAARLPAEDEPAGWTGALLNLHRTALIIRMAMLEGASFFGLVLVLLGVTDGSLAERPLLWLGLVPTVIHLLVSVATFPSRRGLAQTLYDRIVNPLQRR